MKISPAWISHHFFLRHLYVWITCIKRYICTLQVLYEVTVFTGDMHHGGTDANIFMSIFGAIGVTEDMQLMKNGSR